MTNFTTAPIASGETFEFSSAAKNVPTYAVISSIRPEAARAAAEAETVRILGIDAIDEAEKGVRITRVAKELAKSLENPTGLFSKHATRAAAAKSASAARSNSSISSFEVVEVVPA